MLDFLQNSNIARGLAGGGVLGLRQFIALPIHDCTAAFEFTWRHLMA